MHHLYLHIPFCVRRCSYCDFAIAVRRRVPADEYVETLLTEAAIRGLDRQLEAPLATLYLGGGTPSLLPPEALDRVVRAFPTDQRTEVTLEANPDDVSPGAAAAWRAAGVTRLSIGVQSFHPAVLEWMHRTHTAAQAAAAVETARAAGMAAVSVDLIFGLPAELPHRFRDDLERAVMLEPDHVSVYGLTVEPRTPLARWVARGRSTVGTDDRYAAEFLEAHAVLTAAGYEHYEVSNYARPGQRSRHNQAYWGGAAYAGLGPSAHGFQAGTRRWNLREWVAWRSAVIAGRDPLGGTEQLDPAQEALEALYLGLRTTAGVRRPAGNPPGVWREAERAGWLEAGSGDRFVATVEGWLRLDALVAFLTTEA